MLTVRWYSDDSNIVFQLPCLFLSHDLLFIYPCMQRRTINKLPPCSSSSSSVAIPLPDLGVVAMTPLPCTTQLVVLRHTWKATSPPSQPLCHPSAKGNSNTKNTSEAKNSLPNPESRQNYLMDIVADFRWNFSHLQYSRCQKTTQYS